MKERIKASLRAAFNAAKLRINGLRVLSPLRYVIEPTGRFRNEMEKESGRAERNAPAVRSNGSAFWTFPKPKNLEQWWWLFTIGAISVTFLYIVFFSIITQP